MRINNAANVIHILGVLNLVQKRPYLRITQSCPFVGQSLSTVSYQRLNRLTDFVNIVLMSSSKGNSSKSRYAEGIKIIFIFFSLFRVI